jgi:hypothetical protein
MAIQTCLVTYIYLVTYICPTKFSDVGFCPTKFKLYVRPKLKVIGQMSCQVKYLFAALKLVTSTGKNQCEYNLFADL